MKNIRNYFNYTYGMRESNLNNFLEKTQDVPQMSTLEDIINVKYEPQQLTILDGIAVIDMSGVLFGRGLDNWEKVFFGLLDIDDLETLFDEAVESPEVKAIILHIASPGGSVQGIPEFAQKIYKARNKKPIIAYSQDLMCSAAYWIGSACHSIIASQSALIGSIGVYSLLYDTSKLYEDSGIKVILVKSGQNKAIGIEGLPITPEQIKILQESTDFIYNKFTGFVLKGRERNIAEEDMQGLDYWSEIAKQKGLVDDVIDDFAEVLKQVKMLIA
jgi:signal peptide peptidase SppA